MPVRQDQRDAGESVFAEQRPTLLGVAYRMLGSLADAEDVVQEAWLRWDRADRDNIAAPRQYLVTVVSRLAIDRIRQASRHRETYIGSWLPEPVHTPVASLGPAETTAQRDSLSLATLRLLQRLSPSERAVFVLREAFDLPYSEIGDTLGLSEAYARQLHRRGAKHLDDSSHRYVADPAAHRRLVERFVDAARTGNRAALQNLLAQDVTLWADGGGKVRAAIHPVVGAGRVARLLEGIVAKHDEVDITTLEVNGCLALLVRLDDRQHVCSLETDEAGLVTGIQWMSNPDKLRGVVPSD
ncbi:MAG: hypothetical protein ABS81_05585 [Pseudonocardia sp. SCN 72-86]|nr:MAG: hypothetical protein ABS81_05585 [Pseudonocardia sp. SCN 72-86]